MKVTPGRRPPGKAAPRSPLATHREGRAAGPVRRRLAVGGEAESAGAPAGCSGGRRAQSGRGGASSGTAAPVRAASPAAPGLLWAVPASRPPHARPARR